MSRFDFSNHPSLSFTSDDRAFINNLKNIPRFENNGLNNIYTDNFIQWYNNLKGDIQYKEDLLLMFLSKDPDIVVHNSVIHMYPGSSREFYNEIARPMIRIFKEGDNRYSCCIIKDVGGCLEAIDNRQIPIYNFAYYNKFKKQKIYHLQGNLCVKIEYARRRLFEKQQNAINKCVIEIGDNDNKHLINIQTDKPFELIHNNDLSTPTKIVLKNDSRILLECIHKEHLNVKYEHVLRTNPLNGIVLLFHVIEYIHFNDVLRFYRNRIRDNIGDIKISLELLNNNDGSCLGILAEDPIDIIRAAFNQNNLTKPNSTLQSYKLAAYMILELINQ